MNSETHFLKLQFFVHCMYIYIQQDNNIYAKIIFIIDANPVISMIHTLDVLRRTDFTIY